MKELIISIIQMISPEFFYWRRAKQRYFERTGIILSYRSPKDLNQKLMWLTRFWRDPIKTLCADKYLVRTYIEQAGLGDILIPLYGVYSNASEIDYSVLPNQFVLKCNHGCGYNLFIEDKNTTDLDAVNSQLNSWLLTDYHYIFCEIQYKDIPKRIVCEKMISVDAPTEYQFWCMYGEPDSILACKKNRDGKYESWSYSIDWKHLCERVGESESSILEEPSNLEEMIGYARHLSKPFPFVRVDFYEVNSNVYFAELTFSPSANVLSNYKDSFHDRLFNKLRIPKKMIPNA